MFTISPHFNALLFISILLDFICMFLIRQTFLIGRYMQRIPALPCRLTDAVHRLTVLSTADMSQLNEYRTEPTTGKLQIKTDMLGSIGIGVRGVSRKKKRKAAYYTAICYYAANMTRRFVPQLISSYLSLNATPALFVA